MTYTYRCTHCGQIVEITCSISEKDQKEKEMTCPNCGSSDFRRIFNALIMSKREAGSIAPSGPS
ncbi:MAG: hypothetical protein NZ959_11140 [Armatimonadetes bacterium]|nr:hypothetical protein [Armatimonadota bacterium]MDW8121615.1 FmdB family zinc ribbon protein [Armatimonadota bacterium]